MSGLTINEDSTHFCYTRQPEDMTEAGVDKFIDAYAGTDVREMMFNVNARFTGYRSKVWSTWWEGYDPDGNHGKAMTDRFMGNVPPNRLHLLRNFYLLDKRGIDPYARWLDRCRVVGISPWVSMRMNDMHHLQMPLTKRREVLAAAQPQQHVGRYRQCMTYQDSAPDYGVPEVFDHAMALVNELAERYDMDGLELDFSRHFTYLQPHRGVVDQSVMTRFVRMTRDIIRSAKDNFGRDMKLCVKVPSDERVSRWLGLDAIAWAREGLVDYIVPTPVWHTIDFGMAIDEWKRLLDGTGVLLGGALEPRIKPYPRYPWPAKRSSQGLTVNAELARGAAAQYLHQGADRIYLMNFFDDLVDLDGRLLLPQCLAELGSIERLAGKSRRHMITFADMRAPGQPPEHVLPLEPKVDYEGDPYFGQLRIDTGPAFDGHNATVVLEFESTDGPPPSFELYVNGLRAQHTGTIETQLPRPASPAHAFTFDPAALLPQGNMLELMAKTPWKVRWAEIVLN